MKSKVDPRTYQRNYMQLRNFFFRLLYAIAYNCVQNCEDQPSFDFIFSAVHMINFIYITCSIFHVKQLGIIARVTKTRSCILK